MDRSDLLSNIAEEHRDAFQRFIETGEADVAFLTYLDNEPKAQKAVEDAFGEQAEAFRELAQSLRDVPLEQPSGVLYRLRSWAQPLAPALRFAGVVGLFGCVLLSILAVRLLRSERDTGRDLAAAERAVVSAQRERQELLVATRNVLTAVVGGSEGLTRDESGIVRSAAVRALATVGADERETEAAMRAALDDEVADVRVQAVLGLGRLGPAAEDSAPVLLNMLEQDENAVVRRTAIYALKAIDPEGAHANQVTNALFDRDLVVRAFAAQYMAARPVKTLGPEDQKSVEDLIRVLKADRESVVRIEAIKAIGNAAPAERAALDALRFAQGDRDKEVREEATRALAALQPR